MHDIDKHKHTFQSSHRLLTPTDFAVVDLIDIDFIMQVLPHLTITVAWHYELDGKTEPK